MPSEISGTVVAERLRAYQARLGLTIQEMADRCAIPKRSLENYMRLKDPQKPGLDALVSISDGLNISIDWLIGRTKLARRDQFEPRDYAVFCHSVVLRLLHRLLDAEEKAPGVLNPAKFRVMGYETSELAALAAVDFMEVFHVQKERPDRGDEYHASQFDRLRAVADAASVATHGAGPPSKASF